jgi:2-(acetamidomethylene)succinate hydrolase
MRSQLHTLETTPIFAIEAGRGPLVLCMHGITANAYVFEPIMDLLAGEFRVVSIDQRGHGRSGRPARYAAEDFAADVAALVEHLASGPAVLLGHSLGARNAFVAANLHPEHVHSIVAVDFTPFIEAAVLDELEARVKGGDRTFADRGEIEAYLSARYPLLPPEAIRRRAQHGYREVEGGYRPLAEPGAMALTAAGLKASIEDALKEVRQRTVLVRGALSKLVSPQAWARARALRPDLEAVEVAHADHYVPEEQPAAIAALVRRAAAAGARA